jgi:plastocyanin
MSLAYLTTRLARWLHGAAARRLALLATVPLAAACGSSDGYTSPTGSSGDPPAPAATVQATPAIRFTPATIELTVGGTVTFAFGAVPHNVYFDNAPTGAPANITAPTSDQSVTRTFSVAGQYRYNCHIHPGMTGTINVR